MTDEPELRRASRSDDAAIRALLARAFPANPKAHAEFTAWQYWDNPFGETRSWVWGIGDRVVSHWATVAVPVMLDGRAVIGAKGVDIATDPDWRGRGLFPALAARLVEDLSTAGVPVLLSHPNPRSFPAVAAAGLREAVRARVFVAPTDAGWLSHRFHLPGRAAAAVVRGFRPTAPAAGVERLEQPPAGLDELWLRRAVRYGIRRDAGWWRWRYGERPQRPYRYLALRRGGRLLAAAVTRPREAFGGRFTTVLELLCEEAAAGAAVLAAIRREAEGSSHGVVLATSGAGDPTAQAARLAGLRRLPRWLEPAPLRLLVADPAGPTSGDRLATAPWTFTWGDVDSL